MLFTFIHNGEAYRPVEFQWKRLYGAQRALEIMKRRFDRAYHSCRLAKASATARIDYMRVGDEREVTYSALSQLGD